MKKSHKGMRKVSNPEIPVEAFYALGGITVLGIGFFIWRATRNIGGIRQTFEQAVAIANEEGGDYAERAASAIRQAPQLNQGNQTNFVSEFNMGQGTSIPVTTPVTTTGPTTETSNTTSPETTQTTSTSDTTNQTQAPAVDPRPPVVPSGEITDIQKNAILALAPNIQSLREPRNSYERQLSDRDVADIQQYLIRAFNVANNQSVSTSAFADGNIGRMTRALIYWVRSHPVYTQMFGESNQPPNLRVFLYSTNEGSFITRLNRFTRELERRTSTPGLNYTPSGNQTSSSQTSSTPQTSQTFIPPMPDWSDVNSTSSDPGSTRFYTSTGIISVKSKKRKL